MRRDGIERWVPAGAMVLAAAFLVVQAVAGADVEPGFTAALVAVLLLAAWYVSPLRRGPHVDHAQAQARVAGDDLVVYWKPGCTYCIRLMRGLDRSQREQVVWVNVWQDPEAAAFVAEHNDGDVVTPTVLTGSGRRLPMTVEAVANHLAARGAT